MGICCRFWENYINLGRITFGTMVRFNVPERLLERGEAVPAIYDVMLYRGLVSRDEVEEFLDLYSKLADGHTVNSVEIGNVEPLGQFEQQDFVGLQRKVLEAKVKLGVKKAKEQLGQFNYEVGVMTALQEPLNLGFL